MTALNPVRTVGSQIIEVLTTAGRTKKAVREEAVALMARRAVYKPIRSAFTRPVASL
jgi:ABC-type glutathione transport system ATPase component